jgi:hypothetical protein
VGLSAAEANTDKVIANRMSKTPEAWIIPEARSMAQVRDGP